MRFTKMHGTGNDFVILDGRGQAEDWSSLARAMDDRHFGVGGDGIIVALPSTRADLRMRMFNPDGSEAEMCGNGIRCLAKYAVEHDLVRTERPAISIETPAGVLSCELSVAGSRVQSVRVGMGLPRLSAAEIPVLAAQPAPILGLPIAVDGGAFSVTCVSMGNPHAVHFAATPVGEIPLERFGPLVEHHPLFPRRVNFEIVNVLADGTLRARVWERGAGLTLACGTGACAVAVAARLNGLIGDRSEVELPGGRLIIEWDGRGEVYLTGPAVEVYSGDWPSS